MKTLVLHPADKSTDFLKAIYKDLDYTIVNVRPSTSSLKKLIKEHDRLIVLGHGTEDGMCDFNGIRITPWIDSSLVYLLRDKLNSVYIWCNADIFVKKYNLHGFYTGMIISELDEAYMYSIVPKGDDILESNILFAETVAKHLNVDTHIMSENVKAEYDSDSNMIIDFNKYNIYHRD